ncbi:SRPBCC family protein [Maribacter sp. 2210JD10-5]|uniref:SRPBCC family protein n=1 Tax=Maribacter sp. 2210JD10-5 TaxID=3386272 RepID=UPI0039BCB429
MNKSNEMDNKTITITRTFNAPINLVWEAWTRPEHIAEWWSPKGVKTEVVEHDFKVGGKWKYSMPMPNGQEFIAEGVYTEIVEFEKIVSSANFRPMTEGVEIQSLFKPNGNKTDFTFNVVHPTEEYKIQQEKMGIMNGWGSVFERLDELLKNR